jgi:hypothetical protein
MHQSLIEDLAHNSLTWTHDLSSVEYASCVVLSGHWGEERTQKLVAHVPKHTPIVLCASRPLRYTDRVTAYRSGVSCILSHDTQAEEVAAATLSQLKHKIDVSVSRYQAFDDAFLLQKLKQKKQLFSSQKISDLEYCVSSLLENRLARASLSKADMNALFFVVPAIFSSNSPQPVQAILKQFVKNILLETLREMDVGFFMDQVLIVVSQSLSVIAVRAITRRVNHVLSEYGLALESDPVFVRLSQSEPRQDARALVRRLCLRASQLAKPVKKNETL